MKEYIISAIIVFSTMFFGSFLTGKTPKSEWYKCIKPRNITPPNYVFPIVWTILYITLFLAFAHSIRRKHNTINILFITLFILNVLWSYAYFTKRQIGTAAILIFLIILVNAGMIVIAYMKNDKHLAQMLIPHLLWVSFASILNMGSLAKVKICSELMF